MVEVMKIMATSFKRSHACTQSQPCSKPPLTHTSTRDSWTLTGRSGSVSCEVTAPFSWVLVCTRLCLCPPRVCFPSPVQVLVLYDGVNGDLLQEGLCHTQVYTQSPCPFISPLLENSNTVLSQSLWGLWVLVHTKYV